MSDWSFLSEWIDGTTVMPSPDGISKAIVTAKGDLYTIHIQ